MDLEAVHRLASDDLRREWPRGAETHQITAARHALKAVAAIERILVFPESFGLMNYFDAVGWTEDVRSAARRSAAIAAEFGIDAWQWLPDAIVQARSEWKPA